MGLEIIKTVAESKLALHAQRIDPRENVVEHSLSFTQLGTADLHTVKECYDGGWYKLTMNLESQPIRLNVMNTRCVEAFASTSRTSHT